MMHFYDGQVRRYITQMIRLLSHFSYETGKGELIRVPVIYGDGSRQALSAVRDNSENAITGAPKIAIYVSSMEMYRDRTSDSSFVSKLHIRERAYDEENKEYLKTQGKNYTVERLMPAAYNLTFNVDIWSTNTDQKLQILEQILVLFRPSLEIQTTDNYVDWTSLSVVNLESLNWSSRSIPAGTESEIDISTLTLSTPIWISPPAKVKRLGVITNIITSIFNEDTGDIDLNLSTPELNRYDDSITSGLVDKNGHRTAETSLGNIQANVNYMQTPIYVNNGVAQIIEKGQIGTQNWRRITDALPGELKQGVSRIFLKRQDTDELFSGTISLDRYETGMVINWDDDSLPSDTILNNGTGIRYIIDPTSFNPEEYRMPGLRLLLLSPIGDVDNETGALAWKNFDNSDFIADTNDIIEWNGTAWNIIFDASESTTSTIYVTNLNTNKQYRWNGSEWLLSIDGEYPIGTWRLDLDG